MANTALKLMEVDEFLRWCTQREARYELVDGVPVEMMAGASRVHDKIVTNVIIALGNKLRGTPCGPTTADTALRTRIRSVRRPDVTVTCDPPKADVYESLEPKLVVEVLSPSNKGLPWDRKMREYRRHEALQYILLIDSETVDVTLYERTDQGWNDTDFEKMEDAVQLTQLGCHLSLAEIYEDTGLPEQKSA
jgi:Uma2 family endonuclease